MNKPSVLPTVTRFYGLSKTLCLIAMSWLMGVVFISGLLYVMIFETVPYEPASNCQPAHYPTKGKGK